MLKDGPAFAMLPSVDAVLRTARVRRLLTEYRREPVVRAVRAVLNEYRHALAPGAVVPDAGLIATRVDERIGGMWLAIPHPVINATGVVLHTNLGRAPLSAAARAAMAAASGYGDLEYDLLTGRRGTRQGRIAALLCDLTGAEDAVVTVNNASAVLLALTALARGGEVLVSRGQAVEIGGGFRVPAILRQSGARLVDVGTTNKTRVEDFEAAITTRTVAILDVHPSNFRTIGFVEETSVLDLAKLARLHNLVLLSDNGSGALVATEQFGLRHEPMPAELLAAGADLVSFSGDKLVGGPQSGIVVGNAKMIARLRSHQLARAVRPDKLTLAALSATLSAYARSREREDIPIWAMIAQSGSEMHTRATSFRDRAREAGLELTTEAGESTLGGGSLPGESLPTTLLRLPKGAHEKALRHARTPVIARTQKGVCYLDLRTVSSEQENELLQILTIVAHATGDDEAQ